MPPSKTTSTPSTHRPGRTRGPRTTTDDILVRLITLPQAERFHVLDNLVEDIECAESRVILRARARAAAATA